MNKKLLIIIAVVILGLGGYYFSKGKGVTPGADQTSETPSALRSLKDLLAAGVAQKCTFSTTDESGTAEGTTYVAEGKARMDFTSTTSEGTVRSHLIIDGNTSYYWTEGEKTGFKTTFEGTPPPETEDESVPQDGTDRDSVNLDEKVDYQCSAWTGDPSQFTPPSDVEFTDFSQMINPSTLPTDY